MAISASTAERIAVKQVGMGVKPPTKSKSVLLSDLVIPSVGAHLAGDKTWEVQLEGIRIKPKGAIYDNWMIRTVVATIHPRTKLVMKVQGPVQSFLPPPPSVLDEQFQMQQLSEDITGFPTQAPKITFLEALDNALGNAANAREIIAYYVLHTIASAYTDRPVWIIHLRGIPPIPPCGGLESDVPARFRDHVRSIIDAATGEMIIADHVPQPV